MMTPAESTICDSLFTSKLCVFVVLSLPSPWWNNDLRSAVPGVVSASPRDLSRRLRFQPFSFLAFEHLPYGVCPTVPGPSLAVMVMGFEMVMVSVLDPAVRMKIVPRLETALTPWAMVLKGVSNRPF